MCSLIFAFFSTFVAKVRIGRIEEGKEPKSSALSPVGFAVSHEQEFQLFWTKNVFLENMLEFINATVLVAVTVVLQVSKSKYR